MLTFSVEASQKESGREHVRERKFTLSRLRKASSTFVVREVTDVGERVLRAIENGEKLEDMESRKGEEKKKRSAPGVKVAEFVSDGYDKRTYTIAYDDALPPCLPAFGFWLVTIMNRRSSREDGPNSCSGVTWGGC